MSAKIEPTAFFLRWMDDAIFRPFNRILVISERGEDDNERLCAVEPANGRKDNRIKRVSIPEKLAQQASA